MVCEKIVFWTSGKLEEVDRLRNIGVSYEDIGVRMEKSRAAVRSAYKGWIGRHKNKETGKHDYLVALATNDLYAIHDLRKRQTFINLVERSDIPRGIRIISEGV